MKQEAPELSRQQLKSQETKAKIFCAAKHILEKKGYEQLSIKNICEEAGVSNGSFYHHFKTKDDLLSYYIEEQPSINPDLLDMPENPDEEAGHHLCISELCTLLPEAWRGIHGELLYA